MIDRVLNTPPLLIPFLRNLQKQSPEVFYKKLPLKFHNIHRKTPALESLFNKVAGLMTWNLPKKRLQHRGFPVNITKFLGTPILRKICKRLLPNLNDPYLCDKIQISWQSLKLLQFNKNL